MVPHSQEICTKIECTNKVLIVYHQTAMLKTLVTQQDALTLVELPYDTDITMESERHRYQIDMLIDTISGWMDKRDDGHVNGNTFVYFSPQQLKNEHFLGPDFFSSSNILPKRNYVRIYTK